jgi:hypothetical protein
MSEIRDDFWEDPEGMFVSEAEAGFQVDDDQAAQWCLDRIREANAEKERWRAYYEEQLKKITDREDRRIQFFEMKLMQYFGSVPHKQTKTQESYQLPGGKLVLKDQGPKYDKDDEKLGPWLKANKMTDLVKVKESANWAELKKMLKETPDGTGMMTGDGEIVPGITVTERPKKFVVEVKD